MTRLSRIEAISRTEPKATLIASVSSQILLLCYFIEENGLYITLNTIGNLLASVLRNSLLGHNLNVQSGSFIRGLSHIRVGRHFRAGRGLWLQAVTRYNRTQQFSPQIVIGDNVNISFWSHISAACRIEIGDNVLIGSRVVIIDHDHGSYGQDTHSNPSIPPHERPISFSPIRIGSNVWIGDGVSIMAGAEIGEGCVIGSNAVVTGRVPKFSIALGVPAKPIKYFDFEKQAWLKCDQTYTGAT